MRALFWECVTLAGTVGAHFRVKEAGVGAWGALIMGFFGAVFAALTA